MPDLITPSVSATVRGEKIEVSEVVLTNSVNSLATVQIAGHSAAEAKATQQSAQIPAADMAAKAGELQNYVLTTSRITPDMAVTISDGIGGSATFSGFLSGPAFALSSSSVSMIYNGVHAATILDFFDGSVYDLLGRGENNIKTSVSYMNCNAKELVKLSTDNIATILSKMITVYEAALKLPGGVVIYGDAARQAVTKAVTARNAAVLPYVQRFLQASAATTRIPGVTVSGSDPLGEGIRQHLSLLLQQQGGFRSVVVNTMLADFGLQFVCYLNGEMPGARLELISYANGVPDTLTVKADNFQFTAGGSLELPIKGVFVTGVSQAGALTKSIFQDLSRGLMESLAYYPADMAVTPGARVAMIPAPAWAPTYRIPSADTQYPSGAIRAFTQRWPNAVQLIRRSSSQTRTMLEWWARLKFTYLSLAGSRAAVSGPLNTAVQAGRTYTLKVEDGTGAVQLFQGYVESVTHRVAANPPSASTSIEFSHVQASGYEQTGERPSAFGFNAAGGALGFTGTGL